MRLSIPQIVLMSRLLDEALPLDEAARQLWLENLPPEYQDLARALRQALLPGDAEAAQVAALAMLPILPEAAAAGALSASGMQPGAPVGPYELIRLLGAGGMAEVWLARRADGAFKRDVALKLPMLSRLRVDLEQRFARERDILASLEHPQIARFYDAGIDFSGLPYVAMEYVHGEPLTDWCDAHRLKISARLGLIVQVLAGVQYAHEKHIVHRDLKPSNILVTEAGQVRLLDFGVAKLLEAQEADQTPLTNIYGRALTPDYASPELLRGDPVDARSDVYSLGVVLYELLTGLRPYRLKNAASMGLLERAIDTVDVKKPSTQIAPEAAATRAATREQLAHQLRGDLDAIALKALAKQPAERYPSAAALVEDLQRYLEGKPIKALPARLTYRLRKFVLRNKTVVGVTVAAVAATLATVGYTLHRETGTQVKIAATPVEESGSTEARAPAPKLKVPVAAFPPPARSVAVLPFLDLSEKKDQEYFSDGLTEELIDLLSQVQDLRVPARTSSFFFKGKQITIAQIAKVLGVAHVLEGSVRKSGNTLRVTVQLIRADSGYHLWSSTYDRELKDVFKVQDDVAAAVVEVLKVKLAPAQSTASYRTANPEAYTQYLLGRQFYARRDVADNKRAQEAYRKAVALDPNYPAAYAGLAVAEYSVSDDAGDAAGLKRAEAAAEKAIALAPQEADGYAARGLLRLSFIWDRAGAQADFAKALAINPADSITQRRYGRLLESLGRLPEAIAATNKAIEIDPLSAGAWSNLATFLTFRGDYPAAGDALRRALQIQPDAEFVLNNIGTLQLLEGKPEEALATFRKISSSTFSLCGVALAEHTLGHRKESRQALEELIEKAGVAYQAAQVFAWRGENNKAFEWLERAFRRRDAGLAVVKVDPLLAGLRVDPRFTALLRKMNLPE